VARNERHCVAWNGERLREQLEDGFVGTPTFCGSDDTDLPAFTVRTDDACALRTR
jgi:hypothetical protein